MVTGVAGIGKTAVLLDALCAQPNGAMTRHEAAGIPALSHRPGLVLSRALRLPIPPDAAAAQALVIAACDNSPLVIDDAQWADKFSRDTAVAVSNRIRVVMAVTTGTAAGDLLAGELGARADQTVTLSGLEAADATTVVTDTNPALGPAAVAEIVVAAHGNPLVLTLLASSDRRTVRTAVASLVAPKSISARTALGALGLLARPAKAAALGPGVDELVELGLVRVDDATVSFPSATMYKVAASLVSDTDRVALHRRLAALAQDPVEAIRHAAAAGDYDDAHTRAVSAAEEAATDTQRATLLELAARNAPFGQSRRAWRAAGESYRAAGDDDAAGRCERRSVAQPLTKRELEVFELIGAGLTNAQIADRLGVTALTSEDHVRAVLRKTGARSRTEAALLANQRKR